MKTSILRDLPKAKIGDIIVVDIIKQGFSGYEQYVVCAATVGQHPDDYEDDDDIDAAPYQWLYSCLSDVRVYDIDADGSTPAYWTVTNDQIIANLTTNQNILNIIKK